MHRACQKSLEGALRKYAKLQESFNEAKTVIEDLELRYKKLVQQVQQSNLRNINAEHAPALEINPPNKRQIRVS